MCLATLHPFKDQVQENNCAVEISVNSFDMDLGDECNGIEF